MRRPHTLLLGAAVLLGAACDGGTSEGPAAPGGRAADEPAPITVAATVAPLGWLAEAVGGDRVEVAVLVPAGSSPHAYEPTPREIAALDRAALFLAVGHPNLAVERHHLEPALAARPELPVVRLAAAADDHRADDPHLWLSPDRMRAAAAEVAAVLAEIDPAGAATYRENLAAVERRIEEVDAEIAGVLADLPRRRFLVYHPAWGAFADHYGLEQIAIEEEGKEPGPRDLARRIEVARAEGAGTVFVQRGFAERPARVVASELGARVVALDPLAADWDDNLVAAAAALAEELDRPPASGGSG